MKKTSLLNLGLFIFSLWISAEIAGYFLTVRFPDNFHSKKHYLRPVNRSSKAYHQKYGFMGSEVDKSKGRHIFKGPIKMAAFGDSFTYGDEVEAHETWTYLLSERTSSWVQNFGVNSWGFDQALLYYEEKASDLPSHSFIVLGIISDHLKRILNNYRRACSFSSGMFMTKPRFLPHEDGVKLIPNPIRSREDLDQLSHWKSLAPILNQDGCYNERTRKWGSLNQFPYAKTFFRAVFHLLNGTPLGNNLTLEPENEVGLKVTMGILNRFRKVTESHRQIPVVLYYPEEHTLRSYCRKKSRGSELDPYGLKIREFSKSLNIQFIGPSREWLQHLCSSKDNLFEKRYHPSPKLHSFIAELVYEKVFEEN